MNNVYECLDACKRNPLVRLTPGSACTVRDLLLSRIAVGPGVTLKQVSQALDELIALKYPLINRILETAASFCNSGILSIYCANPGEFESLKLGEHNQGYFDPNHGIIVVSTRLPLSEVLIHELSHAIKHYMMVHREGPAIRHQQFCKHEFPAAFSNASKNTGPTTYEADELEDIAYKAKYVGETVHILMRGLPPHEQTAVFNDCRDRSDIFNVRRQKVMDAQRFRKEFFDCFKLYHNADCAEEFLPFFLQKFVHFTCHEKLRSFESWVVKYLATPPVYAVRSYNSYILHMMWTAIPEKLLENFVKGDFRITLDNYVALYASKTLHYVNAPLLNDCDFYAGTLAEPARIIHYPIDSSSEEELESMDLGY